MRPSSRFVRTVFIVCALMLSAGYGPASAQRERVIDPAAERIPVARIEVKQLAPINVTDIRQSTTAIAEKLERASVQVERAALPAQDSQEIRQVIDEAGAELEVLEKKSAIAVQQREEAVDAKEKFFTLLAGSAAVNLMAIIGLVMKFPLLERRYKKLLIAEKEHELRGKNIL